MPRGLIVLWVFLTSGMLSVNAADHLSLEDIRKLSFAVALVDYPIATNVWKREIGFPTEISPSYSSHLGDGRMFTMFALRSSGEASYSLRVIFGNAQPARVEGLQIVFHSPDGTAWIPDPFETVLRHSVSQLQEIMKDEKLSPAEFAQRLPEFYDRLKRNKSNK